MQVKNRSDGSQMAVAFSFSFSLLFPFPFSRWPWWVSYVYRVADCFYSGRVLQNASGKASGSVCGSVSYSRCQYRQIGG